MKRDSDILVRKKRSMGMSETVKRLWEGRPTRSSWSGKKLLAVLLCCSLLFALLPVPLSLKVQAREVRADAGGYNKNVALTGDGAVDIVNVANAQFGKTETELKYKEDWCVDFVIDCAIIAQQSNAIPADARVRVDWFYEDLIKAGAVDVSVPQIGDVVTIGWADSNSFSHTELVTSIQDDTYITLGGNVSDKVQTHVWRRSDNRGTKGGHVSHIVRPKYTNNNKEHEPVGVFEALSASEGKIHVSGWANDPDDINQRLSIHVYTGGEAGDSNAEVHVITANKLRSNSGRYDGFDEWIPVGKSGNQKVTIYAINIGAGTNNSNIGSRTVTIPADTKKPVISDVKVELINSYTYTVSCKVTDNVYVDAVKFPTWRVRDTSKDCPWEVGKRSGDRWSYTYSKAVYDDPYLTHIYAYDRAGNSSTAAADVVWCTEKGAAPRLVEGDVYEIQSGQNDGYVIQVAGGSKENLANVVLNQRAAGSNAQRFIFIPVKNGWYKMKNVGSGKMLDVYAADTKSETNLDQYTENDTAAQLFRFASAGKGYYYIISGLGTYVDNSFGKLVNGNNIWMHGFGTVYSTKYWKLNNLTHPEQGTESTEPPMASATPGKTKAPDTSMLPAVSVSPEISTSPEITVAPENSGTPDQTESPDTSRTPDQTASTDTSLATDKTVAPDTSRTPNQPVSSDTSRTPNQPVSPDTSRTPDQPVSPDTSRTPNQTGIPQPGGKPGETNIPVTSVEPLPIGSPVVSSQPTHSGQPTSIPASATPVPSVRPVISPSPSVKDADIDYGDEEDAVPARVKLKSVKQVGKNKLLVKFNPVEDAEYYRIQIAKGNIWRNSQTFKVRKTNIRIKGFRRRCRYIIRVQAVSDTGETGRWSRKLRIKLR